MEVSAPKRKVEKGYSGRLLESEPQDSSRLKHEENKQPLHQTTNISQPKNIEPEIDNNISTDDMSNRSQNTPLGERKRSMMGKFFTLFPDRRSSPHRITSKPRHWTPQEDELLREAVKLYGEKKWKQIAANVPNRNHTQCLQRWSKVLAPGLKKGQWSREEDNMLVKLVTEELSKSQVLEGKPKLNWGKVSRAIEGRTAKQCRERWVNNLDPEITKAAWSEDEDILLLQLQEKYPKRWAMISKYLPGRTENAVKIRFKSLTRNVTTEDEKNRLREQISRTTLDQQLRRVQSQSQQRKQKERESLKGKLLRIGSGMFPGFQSRNRSIVSLRNAGSKSSGDINTGSSSPVLMKTQHHLNLHNHNLHPTPILQDPLSNQQHMNSFNTFPSFSDFSPNPNQIQLPQNKPILPNPNLNSNSAAERFKSFEKYNPYSDLRRSNRNLKDLMVGTNVGDSAFQSIDTLNSIKFKQKRRASTTTSTVNQANLSFHLNHSNFNSTYPQSELDSPTTDNNNNNASLSTPSHLNLFSTVAPSTISLDRQVSEMSLFKDLILPNANSQANDNAQVSEVGVKEIDLRRGRSHLLMQQAQSSDRSIDMNECLQLLAQN